MKRKEIEHIKKEIPVAEYDKNVKCFRYSDNSYMDIYRIIPNDLVNSDLDEIEMDCFKWAKFYKTYGLDIEIVTMMFPCDTTMQQKYWKKKLQENRNPVFKDMMKRKIDELVYRERHTSTKEFFLFLFFENEEEIADAIKTVDSTMGIGQPGMLEELPEKKKKQILFKLANKNSMIF